MGLKSVTQVNIPSPLFTLIRPALGILGLSCNLHGFVYLKVQFNLHSFTSSNYRYSSDVPVLDMAGLSTVRLSRTEMDGGQGQKTVANLLWS